MNEQKHFYSFHSALHSVERHLNSLSHVKISGKEESEKGNKSMELKMANEVFINKKCKLILRPALSIGSKWYNILQTSLLCCPHTSLA